MKSLIQKLEDLPLIEPWNKVFILWVAADLKPSSMIVLEGEGYNETHPITPIDPMVIASLETILADMGITFTKTIRHMTNRRGLMCELLSYFISKNRPVVERLKYLFGELDDKHNNEIGTLLGYPKSAVDAYMTPNMLLSDDIPLFTDDVSELNMRLLWHRLSKDNWRDEVKYLEESGNYIKAVAPKLYEEVTKE